MPTSTLIPGTKFGSYNISSALGEGGMGAVYRARDTRLGRDVAIKVLLADVANDPERLARFQREAQVLASLNHPHIAAIYGIENGPAEAGPHVYALVLELVEGPTLADRLAPGALSLEDALPIAAQIVEALEAAHEQGIVHRDLKPANIKVRPDGTVKVLDFGLAKAIDPFASGSAPGVTSPTLTSPVGLTAAGMVLGTAAYMSPEQAKGRIADKRCDVWAFGCVLYEMLAGRGPFHRETIAETLALVLTNDPDWTALPAGTPAPIGRLLRRCLEKDPKRRLRDIGDARHEIRDAMSPDPRSETVGQVATRATRSRFGLAAALVAAIAAAALSAALAWRMKPSPALPVTRFSLALTDGQQFTGTLGRVVSISSDGRRLAYVANNQIFSRALSDGVTQPIPGTEGTRPRGSLMFALSPDGEFLALAAEGVLKKLPVHGGAAATICPLAQGSPGWLTWGPSGILFVAAGGVMRVSPDGGVPELIAASDSRSEMVRAPRMLSDGRTLLFSAAKAPADASTRWDIVAQTSGGARRTLIEGGSEAYYVAATRQLVYAIGATLMAVPFDEARQRLLGAPTQVVDGLAVSGPNVPQFSVADDGTLLYVAGAAGPAASALRNRIVTVDQHGGVTALPPPEAGYEFPRLSPDSRRLTFDIDDGNGVDVWVYDMSGASAMRRLTFSGRNRHPIWSRDGQWIAFQSDREGDRGIFRQRADGTGVAERLTTAEKGVSHVPQSWSPAGDRLLFSINKGGVVDAWTGPENPGMSSTLMLLTLQNRSIAALPGGQSTDRASNGEFSPDGAWIAYNIGTDPSVVYVQPFPANGTVYQVSKDDDGHHPWWSRDGRSLFYVPGPDGLSRVAINTQPSISFGAAVALPRGSLFESPVASRNIDSGGDDTRLIGIVASGVVNAGLASKPHIDIVLNWFEELKRLAPAR